MKPSSIILSLALSLSLPLVAENAESLIKNDILNKVDVISTKVENPVMARCFIADFYRVKYEFQSSPSTTESCDFMYVSTPKGVTEVPMNGVDGEALNDLLNLVHPDFRLKTDTDAQTLRAALVAIYPRTFGDPEFKPRVLHDQANWTFALQKGHFDKASQGFTIEVDPEGKITSIKHALTIGDT